MKTFTIDAENNITAHASAEEAVAGAERFATEAELNKLAASFLFPLILPGLKKGS